jgi:hypothetical protein
LFPHVSLFSPDLYLLNALPMFVLSSRTSRALQVSERVSLWSVHVAWGPIRKESTDATLGGKTYIARYYYLFLIIQPEQHFAEDVPLRMFT